jgi:cytidyltransferase-like protein
MIKNSSSSAKASLFVGRWQPFHEGHKALIETVLKKNKPVVIALRDTPISGENPYSIEERKIMIIKGLEKYKDLFTLVTIPDIDEICYGRKVGYAIRQISLKKTLEEISGTKTRTSNNRVIWLTGNSGSGKTTLAFLLRERLNGVVLDGDEMRSSISLNAGFSKKDREEHNLRVARLARVLYRQRLNVIVSVIAPFEQTRKQINKIIRPYWVYVKRDMPHEKSHPYEVPQKPDFIVDTDRFTIMECVNQIWNNLQTES